MGAEFAQSLHFSPLSPSPPPFGEDVDLEQIVIITINLKKSQVFGFELDIIAAAGAVHDAGVFVEGAAVLEHVGTHLAHAVGSGAAERSDEDVALLVLGGVIKFVPNSNSEHVISADVNNNIDHSWFSVLPTLVKDFKFRLRQNMFRPVIIICGPGMFECIEG